MLVGSSAGAYLVVDVVNAGTAGIVGIVGRYGYYGKLAAGAAAAADPRDPRGERPAGPAVTSPEFVERMRSGSSHPVEYAELPGGHHDFDLYESIRSNAVAVAVERFILRT